MDDSEGLKECHQDRENERKERVYMNRYNCHCKTIIIEQNVQI
jgi:hypothetical protein